MCHFCFSDSLSLFRLEVPREEVVGLFVYQHNKLNDLYDLYNTIIYSPSHPSSFPLSQEQDRQSFQTKKFFDEKNK